MKALTNRELLRKYKRLVRKILYGFAVSDEIKKEAVSVEKELMERFREINLLDAFEHYQKLVFNPVDTTSSTNEVLDHYYSSLITIEQKLTDGSLLK